MNNFHVPYLSRSQSESWRRWYIFQSTWFRDYVYIPMGGNLGLPIQRQIRVFLVFIVSGFWHGTNWTFVIWGLVNVLFVSFDNFLSSVHFRFTRIQPNIPILCLHISPILLTFNITCLICFFFRADTLHQAFAVYEIIFSCFLFTVPGIQDTKLFIIILLWMIFECGFRNEEEIYQTYGVIGYRPLRWIFYMILMWFVSFYCGSQRSFIYFRF